MKSKSIFSRGVQELFKPLYDYLKDMSILAPGSLFLVNDERARHEVRITMWDRTNPNWGSLAVGQLVPGDTLILMGVKRIQDDTQAWSILAKGKVGHIFVDEEIRRSLRLLRDRDSGD